MLPQLVPWGSLVLGCSRLRQADQPLDPCIYQTLDVSCPPLQGV